MPDPQLGAVPFQEAITYFRRKLNVTTKRWHDMMRTEHAKGFTVAGATKTDLLLDLRGAVDEAITEGQSLGQFKKGFDQIVAKHGWNFKGKPSWRARTIFNTNLRTATMAGRWEQAQRTKARRPFGIYETAGDERVRPQHREWDRTVLPLDDPWFDVHWPPNGWGCRCHVRTASERQLEREGLVVTKRPPTATVETFDPSTLDPVTGEAQKVDVPVGIDLGWDYNVGKAYLGSDAAFGEKLMQLPARSRTAALVSTVQVVPYLLPSFRRWARQALDDSVARGETRTAGWLSAKTVDFLERYPDAPFPETALITVTDARLRRMQRELKRRLGKAIADEDLANLPQHILSRKAVLYDKRDPALLYVFDAGMEDRLGKFVVRINFRHKGEVSNSIRSGDVTPAANLADKSQFELVEGSLE